jgi:hypothetical protein
LFSFIATLAFTLAFALAFALAFTLAFTFAFALAFALKPFRAYISIEKVFDGMITP